MPCWMKKMPVDSSGSTKPLARPMATQLRTHELRHRPMRIRSRAAEQPTAGGPRWRRSSPSASSALAKALL